MEVFINSAITNGLQAYIAKLDNQDFSLSHVSELKVIESHVFEFKIIDFLISLYGKINIINVYEIKNEKKFKNNLMFYGASEEDIDNFFNLLNEYDKWLNSKFNNEKNNIIRDIFYLLAKLVILKEKVNKISDEEMKVYQDLFTLKDNKINRIVDMSALSKEEVLHAWDRALEDSKKETVPNNEEPLLLDENKYEKYGLELEDVKQLPEEKIKILNDDINKRDESDDVSNGGRNKDKPKTLVLSTGNGFIDGLVLLSIVCTEIMIGVIVTVLLARL